MSNKGWSATRPIVIGLIGMFLLVGGFGTWSVMSEIAGAIVASGRLEVDRNRQVVQHPDGGVVAEILIDEGDTVVEGDTLIRLDSRLLTSQLLIVEGQLFELMARRGRLEAERDEKDVVRFDEELLQAADERPDVKDLVDGQFRLFLARRESTAREVEQLRKRQGQIRNQIEGINAQQASLAVQLELIEKQLADQQSLLDRGLTQAVTVLNLQR